MFTREKVYFNTTPELRMAAYVLVPKNLEAVYAKLGAADRFRGHLYDTPHEFNLEMQHEAWQWLKRWL